jgi:hypothetical protein
MKFCYKSCVCVCVISGDMYGCFLKNNCALFMEVLLLLVEILWTSLDNTFISLFTWQNHGKIMAFNWMNKSNLHYAHHFARKYMSCIHSILNMLYMLGFFFNLKTMVYTWTNLVQSILWF